MLTMLRRSRAFVAECPTSALEEGPEASPMPLLYAPLPVRFMTALFVLFLAAIWAGAQNALAGDGLFITDGPSRPFQTHRLRALFYAFPLGIGGLRTIDLGGRL
jgi:hypothetical protein